MEAEREMPWWATMMVKLSEWQGPPDTELCLAVNLGRQDLAAFVMADGASTIVRFHKGESTDGFTMLFNKAANDSRAKAKQEVNMKKDLIRLLAGALGEKGSE